MPEKCLTVCLKESLVWLVHYLSWGIRGGKTSKVSLSNPADRMRLAQGQGFRSTGQGLEVHV